MDVVYPLLYLDAVVCVRVRQREKATWSVLHSVHLNVSKATIITALLFCLRNKKQRQRERERARIIQRKIRMV
jgi:hypothetical protein